MNSNSSTAWVVLIVLLCITILGGGCWGYQHFKVFSAEKSGEAEFKQAEQNRRIVIEEARAQNESAMSKAEAQVKMAHAHNEATIIEAEGYAEAEVIRARGAAEAQRIIDSTLTEPYLRYLWINNLDHGTQQVIYVPTEGGVPLMEAGKR